ncbi:zinc finger protein 91-like [Pelobates fuscus]|uniref:zinc finger protein 91-like n=1 Tax=Pelobates fuscus TaxID=191477 RepID=UPI002FE44D9B
MEEDSKVKKEMLNDNCIHAPREELGVEGSIDQESQTIHKVREISDRCIIKSTMNKTIKTNHKETPCTTRSFKCFKCKKGFTCKLNLVKHQIAHKQKDIQIVSDRGNISFPKSTLIKHEQICELKKPFSCSECEKCYTTYQSLVIHERIHRGEKTFTCSHCGKCFSTKAKRNKHERIHTGEKPYSCSVCGKCFTSKSHLNQHRRTHTGEKPHACLTCGKCFSTKAELRQHERTHTGEKPFACSACGKCFTTKAQVSEHKRIHTGEKPFACSKCSKCFVTKSQLSQHERTHTGEKPFACSECGKCFTRKANLSGHERVHKGEKPFACSECGKCFTRKANLSEHKRIHKGEKPFACYECGKCFITKSDLTRHERIHTGDKPYACSDCGKCFTTKSEQTRHERIHTGEKPFSCAVCGKCFKTKSDLKRHKGIHTGEKPFSCSECGKCFTAKSNLLTHEKIHTSLKWVSRLNLMGFQTRILCNYEYRQTEDGNSAIISRISSDPTSIPHDEQPENLLHCTLWFKDTPGPDSYYEEELFRLVEICITLTDLFCDSKGNMVLLVYLPMEVSHLYHQWEVAVPHVSFTKSPDLSWKDLGPMGESWSTASQEQLALAGIIKKVINCNTVSYPKLNSEEAKGNHLADQAAKDASRQGWEVDRSVAIEETPIYTMQTLPTDLKLLREHQAAATPQEKQSWKDKGAILQNDVYSINLKFCLSRNMYPAVVQWAHGPAHLSKHLMNSLIDKYFEAPGITTLTQNYCRSCTICAKCNPRKVIKAAPNHLAKPHYPFQRIQIDNIQMPKSGRYEYALVIVDMFSGWPEAFPVANLTAKTTAKHLLTEIVCRYGVPEVIERIMFKDRDQMIEEILDLTMEIICLLTGEDHMVIKKPCTDIPRGRSPLLSKSTSRIQSPITVSPSQTLIYERKKKILELTNQIIQLLTGEVPIRCEDVTVYFSMEEWEYLEGHKDLYKDLIKENHQTLSSLAKYLSSGFTNPESWSNDETVNNSNGETFPKIKDSWTKHFKAATSISQEPLPCEDRNIPYMDMNISMEHMQMENSLTLIKEEFAFCENGNPTNNEMYTPTEHKETKNTLTYIESSRKRKKNIPSMLSFVESRKHDNIISHESGVSPQCIQNSETIIHCPKTEKAISNSNVIRKRNRGGERRYSCSECGKNFTHASYVVVHQRIHTGERPFVCSVCGKCFNQKPSLTRHQKIHTRQNLYKCTECEECFPRATQLASHKWTHTDEKPFKCPDCGKLFCQKHKLIRHQKLHAAGKLYSCNECGKCFTWEKRLALHKRIHTGEKPFNCTDCGKCFTQKHHLVLHKRIHTGEKPYKCNECGKCFTRAAHLLPHKMIHTGEKPFKCNECGKCFIRAAQLVPHKRIHTGEYPFKCNECGKLFNLKHHLTTHRMIHTGEKPFKCSECGKCFHVKHHLTKHRRVHLSEKNIPLKSISSTRNKNPLSEHWSYPVLMNMDWNEIAEKILDLTLGIICLLTGEDQMVVNKLCECVNHKSSHHLTEGSCRTQSPSNVTPLSSLIQERNDSKKILELTNKIIQLLTGEVPIRCEDVTVYFSMEEWEYLEGHKDFYKDMIKENHQTLSSPGVYHTPDFGNNEESVNKPSNGANYLQTSKVKKRRMKNVPYISEESPPRIEENHKHMDIYKQTEYPSSDSKKESALHEEGNLTESNICANTDNRQTSTLFRNKLTKYEEVNLRVVDTYKLSHNHTLAEHTNIEDTCVDPPNLNFNKPLTELNKLNKNVIHKSDKSSQSNDRKETIFLFSGCPEHVSSDDQHVKQQPTHTGKRVTSSITRKDVLSMQDLHELDHKGVHQIISGSDFIQVSNLVRQERDRTLQKPFKCSECGKYFTQAAQFASHKKFHNKERPYKCTECSKSFKKKHHLVGHQKIHTGVKPFKCTECGKCFIDSLHLASHKMIHSGEKPFNCPNCDKCFHLKQSLIRHQMIHTDERPFSCLECGKRFNFKHVLDLHHRVHTSEKPHTCPECGKSFNRLTSLVSHKRTHKDERPFSCSECGKQFKLKHALNRHHRVHTGEKPYRCPECGKSFTRLTSLASHKLIHTGEKPFKCSECGKDFNCATNAIRHKRIHK